MRIISGSLRGRKIPFPKNLKTRPTTNYAKEGLFNFLTHNFDLNDINVLDLFAGSGNISFEFASRGAQKVVAVDKNIHCVKHISKIAKQLDTIVEALHINVVSFLNNKSTPKFDIIFADPPFDWPDYQKLLEKVLESDLLNTDGLFVLEHRKKAVTQIHPSPYITKSYGEVNFSIFRKWKE